MGIALDGETPAPAGETPAAEAPAGESKEAAEEKREYKTNGGRVVYGGGGVTPEWVIEPRRFTPFQRDLELRNLFFNFAVRYTSTHETDDRFEAGDDVLGAFKSYGFNATHVGILNNEESRKVFNGILKQASYKMKETAPRAFPPLHGGGEGWLKRVRSNGTYQR